MYKGCRWTRRLISTEKCICDTLIEVEKSMKRMSGFTNMSDPRIRKSIYKYMMTAGKLNLCSFKGRQSGGGIAGMYSKKPFMIPVSPHTTEEKTNEIHVFSSRQASDSNGSSGRTS